MPDLNPSVNNGGLNPLVGRPTPTQSPKPTPIPTKTTVQVAQKLQPNQPEPTVEPTQQKGGDILSAIHDFICGLGWSVFTPFCKETNPQQAINDMLIGATAVIKDVCETMGSNSGGCQESIRRGRVQAQSQLDELKQKQEQLNKQYGPNSPLGRLTAGEIESEAKLIQFIYEADKAAKGGSNPFLNQ